jgi:cell division septation protein DedD
LPDIRLAALLVCSLLLAQPAFASTESGTAKWRAGDYAGAVADWLIPAARGDAEALFSLGQAHRLGRGVPQDRSAAIDYYRRAAEKGHVAATANLGITLWQEGRKTEALTQLRTAAERGDLRASYVLGVATFEGDVAPRNPALGYAYVLRARDGGLALASGQAARMATRLTADDRARGQAAAAALAAGRPVAVVMAGLAAAPAAESQPLAIAEASEDQAEEASAGPGAATTPAPRPSRTEQVRQPDPVQEKAERTPAQQGWKVQLGAYANERAARTAWATLVSQSATLLKGQTPVYSPRGGLVRLQIGGFEAREPAAELCTRLSAAGRPCFVTR